MGFHEIRPEELNLCPFTKIGREWMLITAGTGANHNTMTAAWGGLGYLWNKNTAMIFIRPQRYTKEFVDREERFTLSFFKEDYRQALTLLGRTSGRDGDKIARAGLTPLETEGTVAFEEAELILVCRKLYHQELVPGGFDVPEVCARAYPEEDYHTLYVGEIEKILARD